jgi:hypothetical protein
MRYSPSNFVLSDEGKDVQKKIWSETIDLLKAEAPEARLPDLEA